MKMPTNTAGFLYTHLQRNDERIHDGRGERLHARLDRFVAQADARQGGANFLGGACARLGVRR